MGYFLDTDESILSMTDENPPVSEEDDRTFCDDPPLERAWVQKEEEIIIDGDQYGIVPLNLIAAQILPLSITITVVRGGSER